MRLNLAPMIPFATTLAGASVAAGATAAVQEATPIAEFVTPDPSECRVEPRTMESLLAAVATPAAGTPADASSSPVAAEGEPADADTTAAVVAAAREVFACLNAGDFLRAYALLTDEALRQLPQPGPLTGEFFAVVAAAPEALPPQDRWQMRVGDVWRLPDGRAIADVEGGLPDGAAVRLTTFVPVGDRYLVDVIVAGTDQSTPPAS